jgi:beta-glucosidase
MPELDVERVLADLTLAEKAALTSGADFWWTKPVTRLGVPAVMVADGPHGLRKQVREGGGAELGESVPATCFPTAAALASSWDPDLLREVGHALGRETRANGVAVLLGPGVNIKRTPLGGRNFEYFSEDPHLAGRLAAALVEGIQAEGVGTSVKHFAANNQETDRMTVSVDVDERTLREIYLPAFERVVREARPWTVMCAYNRLNGPFCSEHRWLLHDVLREEWGFDGVVVSDWGAVHDRVAALAAGLDLQMPFGGDRPDRQVAEAVAEGRLDEDTLDESVRRVLALVARAPEPADDPTLLDDDAHHALARRAAAAGTVLLANDEVDGTPLLPLREPDRVVVVGELARTPRYQGAGSSQVNPTRLDDALTALRTATGADLTFQPGYTLDGADPVADDELREAAVAAARAAGDGVVVAFCGLPPADESEGYDRPRLALPPAQIALITALGEATDRLVVVLANGSAVSVTEWRDAAPAIVETWLGGQAGGSAAADVLLGVAEPGGRLAETIPHRLADTPAYGSFPGEWGHARYGEGVLVGYRWYDTRELDVAFPFGHGLTYTTFAYDEVRAQVSGEGAQVRVAVHARVTNTGSRAGSEVVQVYVRDPQATVSRPTRELRAFAKVALEPGASADVDVELTARDLAFWHPGAHRWFVEGGAFVVEVGASSRDVRGSAEIEVTGQTWRPELTPASTLRAWLDDPVAGPLLRERAAAAGMALDDDGDDAHWLEQITLDQAIAFGFAAPTHDEAYALLDRLTDR